MPFEDVKSDPIGLILPSSVSTEDVTSFHESIPSDQTGLRYSDKHKVMGHLGLVDEAID